MVYRGRFGEVERTFGWHTKCLWFTTILVTVASCSSSAGIRSDWKAAQIANSPEIYAKFANRYAGTEHASKALQLAESLSWGRASSADTLESYQDFVRQFPNSNLIDSARVRTLELARQTFRVARRAQISLVQIGTPTGVKDAGYFMKPTVTVPTSATDPILDVTRSLVSYAGATVQEGGDGTVDFTFHIRLRGQALGGNYDRFAGHLYSGAIVEGAISMRHRDGSTFTTPFSGRIAPPRRLTESLAEGLEDPTNAPFERALTVSGSAMPTITEMIRDVFGIGTLIQAAEVGSSFVKIHALRTLGKTDDPAVVPTLLAAVSSNPTSGRHPETLVLGAAVEALLTTHNEVPIQSVLEILAPDPFRLFRVLLIMKELKNYTAGDAILYRRATEFLAAIVNGDERWRQQVNEISSWVSQ